jgi:Flp pilus assembly pilin Flp
MADILRRAWLDDDGQDIAEYAVMLAVILVIVVGSIRLIGSNANNVFSECRARFSRARRTKSHTACGCSWVYRCEWVFRKLEFQDGGGRGFLLRCGSRILRDCVAKKPDAVGLFGRLSGRLSRQHWSRIHLFPICFPGGLR